MIENAGDYYAQEHCTYLARRQFNANLTQRLIELATQENLVFHEETDVRYRVRKFYKDFTDSCKRNNINRDDYLKKIGPEFEVPKRVQGPTATQDAAWHDKYEKLKAYKEAKGDCNVPYSYESEGIKFGKWVCKQRSAYRSYQNKDEHDKDETIRERINLLKKIGLLDKPINKKRKYREQDGEHELNNLPLPSDIANRSTTIVANPVVTNTSEPFRTGRGIIESDIDQERDEDSALSSIKTDSDSDDEIFV